MTQILTILRGKNKKKYGVTDPSIHLNLFLPSMTETTALRLLSNVEKTNKKTLL